MLVYGFILITSILFYIVVTSPSLQTAIQVAMQPEMTKEMIMKVLASFKNDTARTANSYNVESEDRLYEVEDTVKTEVGVLATCFMHDQSLNFNSPIYIRTFAN